MFILDNGCTPGFVNEREVGYDDPASGKKDMTMLVRISSGPEAMIEPSHMIFMNKNLNYPTRTVRTMCKAKLQNIIKKHRAEFENPEKEWKQMK